MARRQYQLVTHVFKGGRFDNHGLDVDVLPELLAYKTILVETAKELWRRRHPDRQRLPKNFEDSLRLAFDRIEPGSAAIPLLRELEMEDGALEFAPVPDEMDEAVELVTRAINAVGLDHPLPEHFPKNVIPLFDSYGRTLSSEESIEIRPAQGDFSAHYTATQRDRLLVLARSGYEDRIELSGETRAADLDNGSFALRLADGVKIPGKFSGDQEMIIVQAMGEHASRFLHLRGRAEFSPEGKLKRIISIASLVIQPPSADMYDSTARPVWDIVAEIAAALPDDEWAAVPPDASKNMDHYLYGAARGSE